MALNAKDTVTQLAKLKDPTKRKQLAVGVTGLCVAQPLSEAASPIAGDLLVTLTATVDTTTKILMAEQLSSCKWAPHAAIKHLAFEEIEVASIVIKKSKCLSDQDMIEIAKTASLDHRRHLANRKNLCIVVSDTLAEPAEPVVLRALANNDTAEISEDTLSICMTAAKEHPKLREALARRHDLSTDYATQLCIMLPENWREELYRRFGLDKDTVEKMTADAALGAVSESADATAKAAVEAAAKDGKLDANFTLCALKAGNEIVFDHAIATLSGIKVSQWRVALAMGGARAAAMACQAARLETSAYPVIHKALQRGGRMHQPLEGHAMSAAANVFRMYGAEKATKVLRQMGSRV
jgi:uncharacterized protein (DUF2336 family)